MVELDVPRHRADDPELRGALARMWAGEATGVVIEDALPAATCALALERLRANDPPLRRSPGPLGMSVISLGIIEARDLDAYHDAAEHYREGSRGLYRGGADFEARFLELVRPMADGLPVELLHAADGRAYSPSTIRVMPPRACIPVHSGKDFQLSDHARHVQPLLDVETQLSFFVPLQPAEQGGELALYDLEWSPSEDPRQAFRSMEFRKQTSSGRRRELVPVGAGEMIVFDGGRVFHEVLPVRGARERVTVGGFISYTKDRAGLRYYS